MENNTELQDSQKPVQSTAEETKTVALSEWNQLYARAKQAEEEKKTLKDKLATLEKPAETQPSPAAKSGDEIEDVLNLRSQGFSDAEILTARKYAKRMNSSISEVLNDSFFKAGIEAERSKVKSEQATPSSSSRGISVKTNKPYKEMSVEERRVHAEQVAQAALRRR